MCKNKIAKKTLKPLKILCFTPYTHMNNSQLGSKCKKHNVEAQKSLAMIIKQVQKHHFFNTKNARTLKEGTPRQH